jgi:DNA uptake protein ComE-like DNA-binding protein
VAADTVQRVEKLQPGSVVDINTADTSELKRIPGVASYRARKIVEYRQRLGGYVSAEQVMEACSDMPDEVVEWVTVSEAKPHRLDVNNLSVRQLMRHPYVSFYQARSIVEYRRKHGPLTSIDNLSLLISADSLELLRPYLEFK